MSFKPFHDWIGHVNVLFTGKGMDEMNLDELDEIEDDIDEEEEKIFSMYRFVF